MGNSKGGADAIHFSVHYNNQLDLLVLMGARSGPSLFDPLPHEGTRLLGEPFGARRLLSAATVAGGVVVLHVAA